MIRLKLFLACSVFLAATVLTSCASKQADSTQGRQAAAIIDQPQTGLTLCSQVTDSNYQMNRLRISLTTNGPLTSFCQLISGNQNIKSVVVYLTNPTCTGCKPVLKQINNLLSHNPLSKVYVTLPTNSQQNAGSVFTIADAQQITNSSEVLSSGMGAYTIPALDPNALVWSDAKVGSFNHTFPHVIVFDRLKVREVYGDSASLAPDFVSSQLQPLLESINAQP